MDDGTIKLLAVLGIVLLVKIILFSIWYSARDGYGNPLKVDVVDPETSQKEAFTYFYKTKVTQRENEPAKTRISIFLPKGLSISIHLAAEIGFDNILQRLGYSSDAEVGFQAIDDYFHISVAENSLTKTIFQNPQIQESLLNLLKTCNVDLFNVGPKGIELVFENIPGAARGDSDQGVSEAAQFMSLLYFHVRKKLPVAKVEHQWHSRAFQIARGPVFWFLATSFVLGWAGMAFIFYSYTLLHMMHIWMVVFWFVFFMVYLPLRIFRRQIAQFKFPATLFMESVIAYALGFPFLLTALVLFLNVHWDESESVNSVRDVEGAYHVFIPGGKGSRGTDYYFAEVRSPDASILPFTNTVDIKVGRSHAEAFEAGIGKIEIKYRQGYFDIPWVVEHKIRMPENWQ